MKTMSEHFEQVDQDELMIGLKNHPKDNAWMDELDKAEIDTYVTTSRKYVGGGTLHTRHSPRHYRSRIRKKGANRAKFACDRCKTELTIRYTNGLPYIYDCPGCGWTNEDSRFESCLLK